MLTVKKISYKRCPQNCKNNIIKVFFSTKNIDEPKKIFSKNVKNSSKLSKKTIQNLKNTEKNERNESNKNLFLNLFKKGGSNQKINQQNAYYPKAESINSIEDRKERKERKLKSEKNNNERKNLIRTNKTKIIETLKTQQLDTISDFQQFWQNKTYKIFKDLINKKVHIGQHKKYLTSEMQPYIFGYLNNFCIINLNQTIIQLRSALKILYDTITNGGHITIIGTKTAYLNHIELFANNLGLPYVASSKWLGGSLTNFETIEQNFNKQLKKEKIDFTKMEQKKEENIITNNSTVDAGNNSYIEKKHITETINIQNSDNLNYKKLDLFKGLRDMGPSDLLIILNPLDNQNALNEARILGIPVIALVDTNTSFGQLQLIDYPVVANNESLLSVSYFLQLFNFTIRSGLKKRILINKFAVQTKERKERKERSVSFQKKNNISQIKKKAV